MANYRRLFLSGYSYCITMVTHRRNPLLVEYVDLLRESFRESKRYYRYRIDAIVVLPDHIHMVITPEHVEEYPRIIKAIKYNFSKQINITEEQSQSRQARKMKPVWQKRYYEHTIRDERDYHRCIEYIQNNPLKHQHIQNGEVWRYMSV